MSLSPFYSFKSRFVTYLLNCPRIKENAEALIVASKENGLEGNADKTKYTVMSRDQNAG